MIKADIRSRYGQDMPIARVDKGIIKDFKLLRKYSALKKFLVFSGSSMGITPERTKIVWEKLTQLIQHLESQQTSEEQ